MIKHMMKPTFTGKSLQIDLSKWGYKDYFVDCTYLFDTAEGKYKLSMWLNCNGVDDRLKLSSKKIGSHYIPGTKDTIIEYVCRIVHQMAKSKSLDPYVEQYEYDLVCIERGNEMFELERLQKTDDNKE